jgi:hypothetical protein
LIARELSLTNAARYHFAASKLAKESGGKLPALQSACGDQIQKASRILMAARNLVGHFTAAAGADGLGVLNSMFDLPAVLQFRSRFQYRSTHPGAWPPGPKRAA